jgi:hypothetical protein
MIVLTPLAVPSIISSSIPTAVNAIISLPNHIYIYNIKPYCWELSVLFAMIAVFSQINNQSERFPSQKTPTDGGGD